MRRACRWGVLCDVLRLLLLATVLAALSPFVEALLGGR